MQVNPYLFYNGNCEAALKFYQKVLGAEIEAMLTYEGGPEEMPTPPEWKKKIMHAKISIDGEVFMASDADRRFKALAEGGSVNMPFGKTFFSKGFGMCVDQFGIPWMVNCPMEQ